MVSLVALADEVLGIAGLEILPPGRLDVDHGSVGAVKGSIDTWAGESGGFAQVGRRLGIVGGGHDGSGCEEINKR